ncbi:glutathione synthase, partial [Pseudomonas sp. GW531-E2]
WQTAIERITADASDAAAMIDLSMMLYCHFRAEEARTLLDQAVAIQRDYCVVHGDGSGLKVLAFVTPGDFMANTPVDFLLNGSNAVLWLRYV